MDAITIVKELKFRTSRSSGAGGQNVNKVSTKVELLFDVVGSAVLTIEEKERILLKLKNRIDKEGTLHITSQENRTQGANREDVVRKFFILIDKALTPERIRVKVSKPKAAEEKRIKEKKEVSEKKIRRRHPESD